MLNDINLIPDDILFRKRNLALIALKIIVVIVLLGLLVSALFFKFYEKKLMEDKISEIDTLLDPVLVQKLQKAEENYNVKVNEKKNMEELYKNVPVDGLKSTRVMEDISALLPSTVKITNFTFELSAEKVTMNLAGENRSDIALFIKRLNASEKYSNINISEISLKNNLYWVSIECNVNIK